MQELSSVGRELNVRLTMKRDDRFPHLGGGNKSRKLLRMIADELSSESDALVTTGGTQSNHARVCSEFAASRGWPVHLVLHGDPDELHAPEGNLLRMLLTGAEISIVSPDRIAEALQDLEARLRSAGHEPWVVPGGGHTLAGALAFADAVAELLEMPDFVVLPSGTGTTQAGLLAGLDQLGARDTRVIGVSVARSADRGRVPVEQAYRDARGSLGLPQDSCNEVIFDDRWTCGGYEQIDAALIDGVVRWSRRIGTVLDPTYTGKAFLGMVAMIESGEIPEGSHVVFWHTGGLMNALASAPLRQRLATP